MTCIVIQHVKADMSERNRCSSAIDLQQCIAAKKALSGLVMACETQSMHDRLMQTHHTDDLGTSAAGPV